MNSPRKDELNDTKIGFFGDRNMVIQALSLSLIFFNNFVSPPSTFKKLKHEKNKSLGSKHYILKLQLQKKKKNFNNKINI